MAVAIPEVYCTLLMTDAYLPGAMVLAHSLRDNGTKKQLAVLITLDSLHASTIEELKTVFDHLIPVDRFLNKSPANLYLMNRPDLASTFTKIALWRQTQFKHIVYIDADVVALRAPDELFNNPPSFAAVPDIGWPDCFNSGVISLKPDMGEYYALLALAERGISFDGADQGLLNMRFQNWERLSFRYNCTPSGNYQYVPAYRHFQSTISMVHYIGHDKPWVIGRYQTGAAGVYGELLGRWWAVYDKHYRTPTTAHMLGQVPTISEIVHQYVKGEASSADYGFSSVEPPVDKTEEPEAPHHTIEPLLIDKADRVEGIQQGYVETVPPVQQRRFSIDWDPLHEPPPENSQPEAANFPSEIYNMSEDPHLFQAPKNPEPPKGMYYEVPSTPREIQHPPPIFPWERDQAKPTRVFADDLPQLSAPLSETTPSVTTDDEDTQTSTLSPPTPTQQPPQPEPFAAYTRTNAWDDMPEIDRYISALPQNRRAQVQVLFNQGNRSIPLSSAENPDNDEPLQSPSLEHPNPQAEAHRRPSMKLTDFPTELERPSLPVTPAPIRRPSFWGSERDDSGDLPSAEGVPDQSDWDPTDRLEQLQRRQSQVLVNGPTVPRPLPDREIPGSSRIPEEAEKEKEVMEVVSVEEGPMPMMLGLRSVPISGRLNFAGGGEHVAGEGGEVGPTLS